MGAKTKNKKINIVSLGCSKNLIDSETLMSQLSANGFYVTFENNSAADFVIVNTCGFINEAKKESVDTILQFAKEKESGLIKGLFVMGCLSERYKKELIKEIPDVDQYFGVNSIPEIIKCLGGDYRSDLTGERLITTPSHFAYLKISEGCNRKCSFCIIPAIRGKYRSQPIDQLVRETEKLASKGVKELILIAQDLSYYGRDLNNRNGLAFLLERLSAINGIEWIRLHYLYPSGLPAEVLKSINDNPKICKYIDLPVQHINNRILRSMQRGYSKKQIIRLIEKIRNEIPGVALRTTLIVGFPGETHEEFKELYDFIGTYKFDRLGVFSYSHEEGTKAYTNHDNVPSQIKRERLEKIMELQQSISLNLNLNKTGKSFKTIIDRKEGEYYIGRTEFDSPEIDNEVLIKSTKRKLSLGAFYQVEIFKAECFDLFGNISQF